MRGFAASLACLLLALAACAGGGPASGGPSGGGPTVGTQAPPAAITPTPTPAPTPPVAASPSIASTFCAGRTWPPYRLGGVPGITAVSTDRATVEISNRTGKTYYYRVSGWELAQFETCRALGELERERGPIAPGETVAAKVDTAWQEAGLRVTVALWDKPCGEACAREPVGAMVVELSPLEPASS